MCILESWQQVSHHTGNCQFFCGLSWHHKKKKNQKNLNTVKILKKILKWKRERKTRVRENKETRQEETGTAVCCQAPKCCFGFVHSASAVRQAAAPTDASGPFVDTHTHTHRAGQPESLAFSRSKNGTYCFLHRRESVDVGGRGRTAARPAALNCSLTPSPAVPTLFVYSHVSLMDCNE